MVTTPLPIFCEMESQRFFNSACILIENNLSLGSSVSIGTALILLFQAYAEFQVEDLFHSCKVFVRIHAPTKMAMTICGVLLRI